MGEMRCAFPLARLRRSCLTRRDALVAVTGEHIGLAASPRARAPTSTCCSVAAAA